jgi:hypothetical protein
MTLRTDVLPIVDTGRQIVDDLGFRPFTCKIVTRTWSSGKVGAGTPTDAEKTIVPRPKIVEQDGGRTLIVGPLTPAYAIAGGGGYEPSDLRPADAPGGVETFWFVEGPFASGYTRVKCKVSGIDTAKPLRYMVTLAVLERVAPI